MNKKQSSTQKLAYSLHFFDWSTGSYFIINLKCAFDLVSLFWLFFMHLFINKMQYPIYFIVNSLDSCSSRAVCTKKQYLWSAKIFCNKILAKSAEQIKTIVDIYKKILMTFIFVAKYAKISTPIN